MKRKRTRGRGRGEGDTGAGGGKTNTTTTQKKRRCAAASSLMGTILHPLLVESLSYLDEDSIRRACLVCKRYHALIHNHPQLKHKFLAVIQIRAVHNNCWGGRRPIATFVHNLDRHRDKLQQYHKIKILGRIPDDLLSSYHIRIMAERKEKGLQGVVALDMSLPVRSLRPYTYDLIHRFSLMLPNLRELDLSNTRHNDTGSGPLQIFFRDCSCLEKLTYNHIDLYTTVTISGWRWMEYASKLKELYMNDSVFYDQGHSPSTPNLIDRMSDLDIYIIKI